MARAGEAPPRELRPLLRFAKLPPRGVAVIRRVLDDDPAFRAVVAEEADEAGLGRASWLFVTRPEGWEAEFSALVEAAGEAGAAADEAAAEERAVRRLARAEERIARLEVELAEAREREASAGDELAAVRRARQLVAQRVAQVEAERDAALEEVERLRVALAAVPPPAPVEPPVVVEPPPPLPPEPAESPVDVAGMRQALGEALDAVSAALAKLPDDEGASAAPPPAPVARKRPRKPASARRRPAPLPPGILDDSVEAAEHLVRVNGVVVLVDGYNATLASWPDLPLAEQRQRLVDALVELAARTGADATVVFDGVDADGQVGRAARGSRLPVRVLFSPAETPADDVILDLVDRAPIHRPVVVASDDRAVRDGAAVRGASVLSRSQLLATLRRGAR